MLSLFLNTLTQYKNSMSELKPPAVSTSKLQIQLWWITALLIAINVGLFGWQILNGMNISQPDTLDALRWGADYAPLTFLEEPIRLFTSMFFHFGLIHLMLNMWALYIFGSIAEQMLGRIYFIGLYLLAGLMGSLLSGYLTIQDSYALLAAGTADQSLFPSIGAGASGAVMGLGAALTILSLMPILPGQRFLLDKKTLLMVMGINLAMGFMISGINNAAHIGGMLMGALLAFIWYIGEKIQKATLFTIVGMLLGIAILYFFYQYCQQLIQPIAPLWEHFILLMKKSLAG